MASTLKLGNDSDLLVKAQQLWDMLDEMAATNPEAYDKFISNQMKEKDKLLAEVAPPAPQYALLVNEVHHAMKDSSAQRRARIKLNWENCMHTGWVDECQEEMQRTCICLHLYEPFSVPFPHT